MFPFQRVKWVQTQRETAAITGITLFREKPQRKRRQKELDGCIVWNAHNTVLGEEALLIYIVPVCYVKIARYGKT